MRGPALSKENKVEEKNKKQIGRTPKHGAGLFCGKGSLRNFLG